MLFRSRDQGARSEDDPTEDARLEEGSAAAVGPRGIEPVGHVVELPEERRITLFPDGRAIIQGTSDPAVARGLYARYIGN